MTFIASVKARNGVAIIADSLVTTSIPVLTLSKFRMYLRKSKIESIEASAIEELFESQAHHTNDYEEKLVQFDDYTAVTTAGSARIGDQRISEVISSFTRSMASKDDFGSWTLNRRVDEFCKHLKRTIRSNNHSTPLSTSFVFTNFNPKTERTTILEIDTFATRHGEKHKIQCERKVYPHEMKLVMNGQNGISSTLLYGCAMKAQYLQNIFIDKFIEEAHVRISDKRKRDVMKSLNDRIFRNHPELLDELQAAKLRELSIQEAVNLAYLLLKVEMDFQKYTQDIPTIGGVIKIATIDASGYNAINGNQTISPV
ncbi:MAG TPA: hypothetical protein PL188_10955 [Candidatus Cloacimonadota bacterium]|nr:hypothetical protein [Candidatus Cloacimonadota bacterium]